MAKRHRSFGAWLSGWLLNLFLMWCGVSSGVVAVLRFVNPPTTAFMLERRWTALRSGDDSFSIRQQWVPLSKISDDLKMAVIAAEDQKFASHWGFDVEAIEDAVEDRLEGKSSRGASTLTQQVAKNLFLWPGRSFVRKGIEAWLTILIEAIWPKRRILEVHLNVAEFGNGIYGVEAASRAFFQVPALHVDLPMAAQLAAVLPNPRVRRVTSLSPQVQDRADWIVDQVPRLGANYLNKL